MRNVLDKALKSALDWWDAIGVDVPDIPPAPKPKHTQRSTVKSPASKPKVSDRPSQASPQNNAPLPDATPIAAAAKTLADLKTAMENFNAGTLSDRARQCVFSRGNPEGPRRRYCR